MTLATLYPPIAAATIVNVFLFAAAWKASQVERRKGEAPWYLPAGLLAYIIPLGWFVHISRGQQIIGYWQVFATALVGEALGVVIVYGLLNAFVFLKGRSLRERAFPLGLAVFLLALMLSGAFTA